MTSGIYTITSLIDGKLYVGYGSDMSKRWNRHRTDLFLNKHRNDHLQLAWNKYGASNFVFEVLEHWDKKYLPSMENYWCNMLDSHNKERGYNKQPTGPNGNTTHHADTKRKMSDSWKTRPAITETTREKLRAAMVKRYQDNPGIQVKCGKKNGEKSAKKIYRYDGDGNYISEYKSITEAAKELNVVVSVISIATTANITLPARRKTRGYFLSFTKTNKLEIKDKKQNI